MKNEIERDPPFLSSPLILDSVGARLIEVQNQLKWRGVGKFSVNIRFQTNYNVSLLVKTADKTEVLRSLHNRLFE